MIYRLSVNLFINPGTDLSDLRAILSRLYPVLAPDQVLEVVDQDCYFLLEECHHDETPPVPCSIIFKQILWKKKLWP